MPTFFLIIKNICITPRYPNNGYKVFTKLENPIFEIGIAKRHINIEIYLYVFLFLKLDKKPYPY